MNKNNEPKDSLFLSLIEGMDLPSERVAKRDFRWLFRNAGFRNFHHPNFKKLMDFLKEENVKFYLNNS